MFVRDFVELPLPAEVAQDSLLSAPGDWIPGLAVDAHGRGEVLLADVGFGAGTRIEKLVAVELGQPIRLDAKILLPVSWTPVSNAGLFPALQGDIEIAPMGPSRCQLSMTARYDPPFGLLGRVADRALLHRVAEATVRDFIARVAESLTGRLAAHPGP